MNDKPWVTLIVSSLSDFVISAGGCLTTAMVATGSAAMPTPAVLIFSVVTGLVAAARGFRSLISTPPGGQTVSTKTETVATTVVDVPKGGS